MKGVRMKWAVEGTDRLSGKSARVEIDAESEAEAVKAASGMGLMVQQARQIQPVNYATPSAGPKGTPKLIACPACSHEVSDMARSCPKCGHSMLRENVGFGEAFLIILGLACLGMAVVVSLQFRSYVAGIAVAIAGALILFFAQPKAKRRIG